VLVLVLLTMPSIIVPLPVNAVSKTIVVPDDYPTIAAAIENAVDGDIVFVRKGTYNTITLTGEGAPNCKITNIDVTPAWDRYLYPMFPPSPPVAIQVNASNVKVSGFTINGIDSSYEPLRLLADGAQIEDNIIEYSNTLRVSSDNNTITGNSLSNIKLIGAYNKILHNTLTGNASIDGAIYIKGSYNIVFSNTINDVAVYGFYSGINIEGDNNIVAKNNLTRSSAIEIETGSNNIILGNKLLNSGGVYITAGSGNVLFANRIENAGIGTVVGGYSDGALNSTLYHNNFINNTEQVLTSYGGGSLTYFDNGREGNYWSDYAGEDADGDGIGDTPYIIHYRTSTRRDNYPLMAPFDISTVTMEVPDWAFSVLSSLQSPSPSPSLEPDSKSEPLVTALIVALVITITVEGIGLLIYFKKRKH
jgi:hypothetical protein